MTPAAMTPRREMAVALGLVVVGAAIALVGGSRSTGAPPGVPAAPGTTSGSGSTALALVALAGAGAILLVRTWARVTLAVVLAAVAVGLVATGLTPTRWAPLVGGVLVGLGAIAVVLRARHWPKARSRYDAPAGARTAAPRDTWDALDRGEDPTA
jgi:Tryptophan-associated transmembrane protein (Trp_oprn_chp)